MFGYFKSGASKGIEFLKSKSGVAVVLGGAIVIGGLYYYFRKKQDRSQGDSLPPKYPPKTKVDDSDDNGSKWINQERLTNVQKESDSTHKEDHIELVIEESIYPPESRLYNLELEAKEEQVTKDVSGILIDRIDSNIENAQYINEDKSHVSIQRQTNEFESVVLDSSQSPEELDEESVIKYEIIKNIDDIIKEQWASIEQLRLMENIAVDNLKIKNINIKEVVKLIICQKIYNYSWKTLDLEWGNYINHKVINTSPSELQKNYWYIWKKDGRLEKLHKIFEGHPMYREIERFYKKQFELVLQQQEEAFDEGFNIKNMEGWQSPDIGISIPKAGSIISTKLGGKKYFGYNFLKGGASSFDSQAYEHAYFRYVKEHVISSSGSSSGGVYSDWAESYKTLTLEDKIMEKESLKLQYKWLDAFARLIIYDVRNKGAEGDSTQCIAITYTESNIIVGLNTGSSVNLVSAAINLLMSGERLSVQQHFNKVQEETKQQSTSTRQFSQKKSSSSKSSGKSKYSKTSTQYDLQRADEDITEFCSHKYKIANLPITYIMNGMQVHQETPANLEIVVKMHAEMSIIQYLLSIGHQFAKGLYIGNNKYACPGCHASMTLLNKDKAIKVAYRGHHNHFEGVAITVEDLIEKLGHKMQGLSKQIEDITPSLNAIANLFQQNSIMESIIHSQALSMEEDIQQISTQIDNLHKQVQKVIINIQKIQSTLVQSVSLQQIIQYSTQTQVLNQRILSSNEVSNLKDIGSITKLFQDIGSYECSNISKFRTFFQEKMQEIHTISSNIKEENLAVWIQSTIVPQMYEFRAAVIQSKQITGKTQELQEEIMKQLQELYQQTTAETQALHQQIMEQAQTLHQSIIAEIQDLHQQVTGQVEVLCKQVTGQAQSLLEQMTHQIQNILQQPSFNHKQVVVLLEAQRFFQQVSEGKEFEPYIAIHDSYQVIPYLVKREQELLHEMNTQAIQEEISRSKPQNPKPSNSPAGGFSDEEGYGTQKEFSVTPQSSLAFPPETSYYNTDTNSWYNDNHIHRLLNYYLPEYQGYTVITPFIFNENNIHIYTAQAVQAAMTGQVVAMPINLGGNHWVGAVMWVEQGSQTLRVIYNDPLGHGIQEDAHAIYFIQQLTIHTSTLNMQLDTFDTQILQQQNYNDCGAFTTQNSIELAQAAQQKRGLNNEEAMQILQQVDQGTTIRQGHNATLQHLGQPEIPYPQQHQEYKGITEAIGDISGMDITSFDVNLYSLNPQEGSLYTEVLSLEGLVNKMQADKRYLIIDSERENPGSQLKLSHILHQPNVEVKFTGIQYNCDSNTASCADNVLLSQIAMMQKGYKTYVLQTQHDKYSHLSLVVEHTVAKKDDLMQKVAQIENGEYQITDRGEEAWEHYKSEFVNSIYHVDKLIEKGNAVSQYAIKQKQLIVITTENKNDKPKIEETNGNVEHSECKSYTLVSSNFSFLTPYALDEKLEAQAAFQTLQGMFDKDYQFDKDINQNINVDTDWCNNPIFNIGSFVFPLVYV